MTIDMQRTLSSALMRPAWVAVAVLALPGQASAQTRELATRGELLDRVAAIVNDGVVLSSELDAQVQVIGERLRQQKLELPAQNVLRQQVLERLVLQEIQMQRANRAGIKVSDEQVNSALQDVARRNSLTLSQLPDALAQRRVRSEEHTSELQSRVELVCRLLLEKKKNARIVSNRRDVDE